MSRRWGFICACVVRHSCVFSLSANLRLPSRRFAARHPCLFSLASRRASHFSLSGHCAAGAARTAQLARRAKGRMPGVKKVTKEKATPIQRSPGSCPATAQRDSGGSPTVHPWTDVELGAIHCAHPSGFPYVTLPLHRGPIERASCAPERTAKTKQRRSKAKKIRRVNGLANLLPPQGGGRCPAGRMRALGCGCCRGFGCCSFGGCD